mmetsp:Transcript_22300/g.51038  ORF Transcript_22300/g.51038 Transcript_22300/m.51038 type:complete len:437 (+) Transcript_22300:314-1624(+)
MAASHRCVLIMACSASSILDLQVSCKPLVLTQPCTATPVDMTAPTTPKALAATGIALTPMDAVSAAAVPPSTTWSAMFTAVCAMATPTCMPCEVFNPSSLSVNQSPFCSAAFNAPSARSLACNHSCCNSATAKLLMSATTRHFLSSATKIESAAASPADAAPPETADPMPKPMPTGGATNSAAAPATAKPALSVLVLFTAAHWPVKRASKFLSCERTSRRTDCKALTAATSRLVVVAQCSSGSFDCRLCAGVQAASAASKTSNVERVCGLDCSSSQNSHSGGVPAPLAAFQALHTLHSDGSPCSSKVASTAPVSCPRPPVNQISSTSESELPTCLGGRHFRLRSYFGMRYELVSTCTLKRTHTFVALAGSTFSASHQPDNGSMYEDHLCLSPEPLSHSSSIDRCAKKSDEHILKRIGGFELEPAAVSPQAWGSDSE